MKKELLVTAASQQYTEAYKKHYEDKDLYGALQSYSRLVVEYPDHKEADYCNKQILNIVRDVVPMQELNDTHLSMALRHTGHAWE